MKKYIERFNNYIKRYDLDNDALKSKQEHTTRVVKLSEDIIDSIGVNEKDKELALIIGLFHDIGRFYQYDKYHNFNDLLNVDHAKVGVKILKEEKIIDDLEEKELVYKAIENHNKFKIDDTLNDREKLFTYIIRDADKIDILKLVLEDKIHMKTYNEEYSKEAVNKVLNGQCILLSDFNRKVDQSLVKIGLLNDLVFPYSKKYVLENNILDKLILIYENNNKLEKDNLEKIKEKVKERLSDNNVR